MKTGTHAMDRQLIQAFQEGNDGAFEVLVNRYQDKLFTTINILVQDKYLAEDLFQDTFTKIIDHLRSNRYREEGKFLPWAMQIARNLCLDHLRRGQCSPIIRKSCNGDIFRFLNGAEATVDVSIVKRQSHHHLGCAINSLSEKQREVIVLRHFGDLSFKEIAALVGCSINTALGRMHYGLSNIRKMIAHQKVTV